jgi:hypothetical protein
MAEPARKAASSGKQQPADSYEHWLHVQQLVLAATGGAVLLGAGYLLGKQQQQQQQHQEAGNEGEQTSSGPRVANKKTSRQASPSQTAASPTVAQAEGDASPSIATCPRTRVVCSEGMLTCLSTLACKTGNQIPLMLEFIVCHAVVPMQ